MHAVLLAAWLTPTGSAANKISDYLDVQLRWHTATAELIAARRGHFAAPTTLPRFRGRFTLIVARGNVPLGEVYFDFPLLANAESPDFSSEAQVLAKQLRDGLQTATTSVRVPLPAGTDTLSVYDNLTRKVTTATLASLLAPPTPRSPDAGAAPGTTSVPATPPAPPAPPPKDRPAPHQP